MREEVAHLGFILHLVYAHAVLALRIHHPAEHDRDSARRLVRPISDMLFHGRTLFGGHVEMKCRPWVLGWVLFVWHAEVEYNRQTK